jgi:rubrerythrin
MELKMSRHEELEKMIEALTLTIAIHAREADFFRRSAAFSLSEDAKALFLEIAEEMNGHIANLESRKNKLANQLAILEGL